MKKAICFLFVFMLCIPRAAADTADTASVNINAKSAVLMEYSSGEILYEQNPDEQLPIASVTKIMTMLLIMEAIDSGDLRMDDIVTASARAKSMGGSTMFLEEGEQLSVHDMLKGIAVASANDGCVAMAEHIAGSEEAFVALMNNRAAELGMMNTHFVNTNGLDAEGHFSTAHDVALMSAELLKHKKIFEFTTIWTGELRDGAFQLANTNKLIRFYKGANGLKTGSTSAAGCCISATAERDGMQLIAVILGAPSSNDRFNSAKSLLDYGFGAYAVKSVVSAGDGAGETTVIGGYADTVRGVYEEDFSALIKKNSGDEYTVETEMYPDISTPVANGDVIGTARIMKNGELVDEINIAACESVEKRTFRDLLLGGCLGVLP